MTRDNSLRALVLAFCAVVACFIGSTAYTQWQVKQLDEAAFTIANVDTASIESLASMRGETHDLLQLLNDQPRVNPSIEKASVRPEASSKWDSSSITLSKTLRGRIAWRSTSKRLGSSTPPSSASSASWTAATSSERARSMTSTYGRRSTGLEPP